MPVYEYCCDGCMHRFELRRSFSDESEVTCPRCSGGVRQVYSPAPIIFKGSGFYITDVKRAGSSTPAPLDKKPDVKNTTETPAAVKSQPKEAPASAKTEG